MTLMRRPSPFGDFLTLRQAVDRMFDEPFYRPFHGGSDLGAPALDVRTTADALVVEAALPGVKPEDVDITVENGTLAIRAESKTEAREGEGEYLVREITRGSFVRTISLPNGLEPDKAEATFEHGVLTLRIPKAEQVKPRQIRISAVTNGTAASGSGTGTTTGGAG
ncbi:MAG TPA: Hsp20/alpha crystallin family protein [Candidatus Limnocylindrales bacterium]|nr:Hsp20/alpha crystallin family protein [Candidatus Limnocylindrales bacterium]